jgi:hypothetical protein
MGVSNNPPVGVIEFPRRDDPDAIYCEPVTVMPWRILSLAEARVKRSGVREVRRCNASFALAANAYYAHPRLSVEIPRHLSQRS